MRVTAVLLFFILPAAQAAQFRVLGVQNQVLLEAELPIDPPSVKLGELTDRVLRAAPLNEYTGSSAGLSSVNGLGSALEVVSDTDMNAYGWCYKVDGVESNLLADQYVLTGHEKTIDWFYAYARMENNRWTAMCVPADHVPVANATGVGK